MKRGDNALIGITILMTRPGITMARSRGRAVPRNDLDAQVLAFSRELLLQLAQPIDTASNEDERLHARRHEPHDGHSDARRCARHQHRRAVNRCTHQRLSEQEKMPKPQPAFDVRHVTIFARPVGLRPDR